MGVMMARRRIAEKKAVMDAAKAKAHAENHAKVHSANHPKPEIKKEKDGAKQSGAKQDSPTAGVRG